jgi:valyl-tRNA synthetase
MEQTIETSLEDKILSLSWISTEHFDEKATEIVDFIKSLDEKNQMISILCLVDYITDLSPTLINTMVNNFSTHLVRIKEHPNHRFTYEDDQKQVYKKIEKFNEEYQVLYNNKRLTKLKEMALRFNIISHDNLIPNDWLDSSKSFEYPRWMKNRVDQLTQLLMKKVNQKVWQIEPKTDAVSDPREWTWDYLIEKCSNFKGRLDLMNEIEELQSELETIENRLNDDTFIANATEEITKNQEDKIKEISERLSALKQSQTNQEESKEYSKSL